MGDLEQAAAAWQLPGRRRRGDRDGVCRTLQLPGLRRSVRHERRVPGAGLGAYENVTRGNIVSNMYDESSGNI